MNEIMNMNVSLFGRQKCKKMHDMFNTTDMRETHLCRHRHSPIIIFWLTKKLRVSAGKFGDKTS